MADEGKTEKATARRRQKAKEEGQIARSRDLSAFFSLASFSAILFLFGNWFVKSMINSMRTLFSLAGEQVPASEFFWAAGKQAAMPILLFCLIIMSFQALDHFLQTRFYIPWKSLKLNFKKVNLFDPGNYKRFFSLKTVFELVKSVAVVGLVGAIAYFALKGKIEEIVAATLVSWQSSLPVLWGVFKTVMTRLLGLMLAISIVDYLYQKWDHEKRIRMSKQEIRDEQREMMGNPQTKERIRKAAVGMLRQKALVEVPKATFVAVNPTHYSVAVRWERGEDPVPRVLVKGVDEVALFMREIAKDNGVPIVENPPLARELYARVDNEDFVPEDMYEAVVAVLHYLVQTKQISI